MASLLRPLSLLSRRTREHENEHQSQEIIKIHFYSGGKGFVRDCLLVSQATQQFGSNALNWITGRQFATGGTMVLGTTVSKMKIGCEIWT